ncbi:MAG: zinc ribbon domain-containing protein, partial [Dehalococcoidia bacterium]|nr:zinc ribbon domain-containing protein [Dehalococcoidia bacterium]
MPLCYAEEGWWSVVPIYEYRCNGCQRRVSIFQRSIQVAVAAACSHCGSTDLTRLISRVAVMRSEESHFEDLASDASLADLDESDPRSVARWARRMGREMGEELGPEFDEMVERMEAGEMPEDLGEG